MSKIITYEINPWPEPKPGQRKGPSDMQRSLFIHDMPIDKRPHNHTLDIVLMIGGAGSGKTSASIAQTVSLTATTPNIKTIVGGRNYPLLKRNVVTEFAKRFGQSGGEWNHPLIKKRPTQNEQMAKIIPPLSGTLQFLNLDKYLVARGFDADLVFIEEVNLMEAESFDEMIRRSRGRALEIRQFILTCNPSGERDWLYDKFSLQQFEEGYEGPPIQIGEPCKCQFCHYCLDRGLGEFEWVGGDKKFKEDGSCYSWEGGKCPNDLNHIDIDNNHIILKKDSSCPGSQHFYRVVLSASYDNPHNPSDYIQNMRSVLDPDSFDVFVLGKIKLLRKGKVYPNFSSQNVFPTDIPLNWDNDIYWAHDFNVNPMCSVICQETEWGLHAVDEIIKWDANEEKAAKAFVEKYQGFEGTVYIVGDPAGLYGASRTETRRTSYQVLYDYLRLHKFNVEVITRKIQGKTRIGIKDRINNVKAMIKNAKGEVRLRINPQCKHLIQSLAAITWDEKGNEEDKKADERAKDNPRREQLAPIMTHPSCALGYLIANRFPLIIKKHPLAVMETSERSIQIEEKEPTTIKERKSPQKDSNSLIQTPLTPKTEADPVTFSEVLQNMGSFLGKDILYERLEYEKKKKEEESRKSQELFHKFLD